MLKPIRATQNKNLIGKDLFHLQVVSDFVFSFKANLGYHWNEILPWLLSDSLRCGKIKG